MNLQKWQDAGKYFDFNGLRVFYQLTNQNKEMLLCLHGFPTSSHDYYKIWTELSERFDLLAFDMIGYGFSDKPADFNYTTFNQVDVLQALLEHLKVEKIHILSHDYGNTIIQELLARVEEKRVNVDIASICMLNGALFPETHRPILAQKLLLSPVGFLFGRLISDARFKQSLASVFGKQTQPNETELDEFLQVFKFNNGRKIAYKLIRYMLEREKYRERWVGSLQKTKVPLRLINGLADPVSGAHLVKRFREIMPQSDIIEVVDIGHFPHFEVPDKTLRYFFEFHEKT